MNPAFRKTSSRHALASLLAAVLVALAASGTMAEEIGDTNGASTPENVPFSETEAAADRAGSDLDRISAEIELSTGRIAEIRAEIEALGNDGAALTAQLVAAGERVDAASGDVRVIEDRLQELFAEESVIRSRLDGQDRTIATLLSALQRISANPPPAIIVDPADALGSARAAMLLGALVPQLRQQAQAVTADLEALAALKGRAGAEADILHANLQALNEERLRIATVIEARREGVEWLSEELIIEEAEAQALANRATSLEQLISGLETRLAAVSAADAASRAAAQGEALPSLDAQTVAIAFSDTERTAPALPLAAARGYLAAPVPGVNARTFGASDGFGGTARGLSIITSPGEEVHIPADGWIAYAGPFLNYGQIVVLDAGDDYTLLLAGLDTVSVEEEAFVRRGDPIGRMGEGNFAHSLATGSGADEPTLYIELREGGDPINPAGWWVADTQSQESGSSQ